MPDRIDPRGAQRALNDWLKARRAGRFETHFGLTQLDCKLECAALASDLRPEYGTLSLLQAKYKIDLNALLDCLLGHRLTWRCDNLGALFSRWNARQLARNHEVLRTLVEYLELSEPIYTFLWHGRLEELAESLRHSKASGSDWRPVFHEHDPAGLLEAHVEPVLAPATGELEFEVPFRRMFRDAIRVLRCAAATKIDWANDITQGGKSVFKPGAKRKYDVEALAAHDLIEFFRRETNRPLKSYVGSLLRAVFPTTLGHRKLSWGKGLNVEVDALLKRYPRQPIAGASRYEASKTRRKKEPKTRKKKR